MMFAVNVASDAYIDCSHIIFFLFSWPIRPTRYEDQLCTPFNVRKIKEKYASVANLDIHAIEPLSRTIPMRAHMTVDKL